jgi:hypothetical protein
MKIAIADPAYKFSLYYYSGVSRLLLIICVRGKKRAAGIITISSEA